MRVDKRDGRGHSSPGFSSEDERSPEDGSSSSSKSMLPSSAPPRERQSRRSRTSPPGPATQIQLPSESKPDQGQTFGNTMFAVSGIPHEKNPADWENLTPIDNEPQHKFAGDIPMNVTQEPRISESESEEQEYSHRARQRIPLRAAVRPYNPHPHPDPRSLVPIHDPRRALSPGPEHHRPQQLKAEYTRRAISPGPGQGLSSVGDPAQALRGKLSESNQRKRRDFFRELAIPTVVNPTKLQQFPNGTSGNSDGQA